MSAPGRASGKSTSEPEPLEMQEILRRLLRVLAWIAVIALFVYAAKTYAALPKRVAVHFGFDGRADRWAERSLFTAFQIPVVTLALLAFMEWLSRVVARNPTLVNVPGKERFLKLPPAFRVPVTGAIQFMLTVAAFGVVGLFWLVHLAVMREATGGSGPGVYLMIAPIGLTMLMLYCMHRVTLRIGEAERRWKSAGSPRA